MPDIPETEAKVTPDVSPGVDLPMAYTPEALGAGVGQALGTAGEVATRVYHDAKAQADQTAILDADNQTNAFLNQRLYDGKTGMLHQQLGQDAPAAVDKTLADFDTHTSEVSGRLANDQQRLSYQRMVANRRFDLERQLGTYEHGEVSRAQNETRSTAIANRTTTAIQSAGTDTDRALQSMVEAKAIIADDGRGKHQSDEVIQERQAEFGSATHLAVLENLTATGQDRQASSWYDAHKDEMRGRDAVSAAHLVEAGSLAGEATRRTDQIVQDADGNFRSRLDVDKDVAQIANPKLRDAVQTRADQALSRHQQGVAEARRDQMESAVTLLNDPGNAQGPYNPKFVAMTATMPEHDRDAIMASWQKRVDPLKVDEEMRGAATDPDAFLAHMRSDGPQLLMDLGPQGYGKLQAAEKEIREKGRLGNSAEIFTKANVVDQALGNAGFSHVSKESGATVLDRENPGAQAFLGQLQSRFDVESRAKGHALTPEEMQKVADQMTIQSRVRPAGSVYGYGKPTPAYQLAPEQRDTASSDLAAYAKTNPGEAANLRATFADGARRLGMDTSRLTDDQMNRAFAQHRIASDLAAAGDRSGAQHAVDRLNAILVEHGATAQSQGGRRLLNLAGAAPGTAQPLGARKILNPSDDETIARGP